MESFSSIIHPKEKLTVTQVLGAANDAFHERGYEGVIAQQWRNGALIYSGATPATRAVIQAEANTIIEEIREKISRRYHQALPPMKLVGRA